MTSSRDGRERLVIMSDRLLLKCPQLIPETYWLGKVAAHAIVECNICKTCLWDPTCKWWQHCANHLFTSVSPHHSFISVSLNLSWLQYNCTSLKSGFPVSDLTDFWIFFAELYRNNVFGGTAFSSYGAFWMGFGILNVLAGGKIIPAPSNSPSGSQMALILWGK